ncbi:AAA family ATPase [Aromatoleum aromaticum]|nr:AAA family ATPase [Aromatoleum aromaticum]
MQEAQKSNGEGAILAATGEHTQSYTASIPQPTLWGQIPAALRQRPQWCHTIPDSKAPHQANGRSASPTNPAHWCDFETACDAAARCGGGIGYVLTADDPFACIDLDVKDDTTQEQRERFDKIVSTFDSYTERSRSGKGMHVWVEGEIGKGARRDSVEVYSQERFIICTGNVMADRPITPRHDMLDVLVAEMRRGSAPEVELEDDPDPDSGWYVVEQALDENGAFKDEEFGRLFAGDLEGRNYPSQSEADLELVKLLARCTGSNEACWSAFRMSALGKREKAKRPSYKRSTLVKARTHLANDAVQEAHGKEIADALFWRLTGGASLPSTDTSRHFQLLTDDDLQRLPPQRWLVKDIIPDGGFGTLYGQSGTFKSFLVLDLLAHISTGSPWFGHRVKAAPAVYIPFEGQGGIPKRVAAWRLARSRQAGLDVTTNMRFITDRMNLRLQADREKLVTTLIEKGWAGGVLCLDTLAQAGGGIDENGPEGMGEMIAIFQELQHKFGGTVLVIHHSGKVEAAGMRGWSGLRGALDFAIKCQKAVGKNASKFDAQFVLDKVKDGEDGKTFDFSMLRVHLGYDEEGDEVTSLAVTPRIAPQVAPPVSDSMRDVEDDEFIWNWIKNEVAAGHYPSKNSLKGDLNAMKEQRPITQVRISPAVDRLLASGRLQKMSDPSRGNPWLRAIETTPSECLAVGVR